MSHNRDTSLVRFGFRDYDPDVGRWTVKDPIGFLAGDVDLYGYCLNDAINAVDPIGLYGTKDCSYYEKRCEETGHAYYCIVAPRVCKYFPPLPGNWDECMRQCLQEYDDIYCRDKSSSPCEGPKRGGVISCQARAHSYCGRKCFQNSDQRPPFPGGSPPW
jgi:RHS repeat-associated protein